MDSDFYNSQLFFPYGEYRARRLILASRDRMEANASLRRWTCDAG